MNVCMLLHKELRHDARVRRAAATLAGRGHAVTVVEIAPRASSAEALEEGYRVATVCNRAWLKRLAPYGSRWVVYGAMAIRAGLRTRPDVVHAHDDMLATGWALARLTGAPLVWDSHELATSVTYGSRRRKVLTAMVERRLVPRCDAVITVSEGIAERLRERYRLSRRPAVVRNFPDASMMAVAPPPDLRARFQIGSAPLVLHQGMARPGRGCEALIRSLPGVVGAHLLFLGDGRPRYLQSLSALAAEIGVSDRVHFEASVPLESLLGATGQADVGVSLLEPTCDNHLLALPNKVFEYVAAGVPVVASRLPELQPFVERHGLGWTVDPERPEDIARAIRQALARRGDPALRERLARAAAELSWKTESPRLEELYGRLTTAKAVTTSRLHPEPARGDAP